MHSLGAIFFRADLLLLLLQLKSKALIYVKMRNWIFKIGAMSNFATAQVDKIWIQEKTLKTFVWSYQKRNFYNNFTNSMIPNDSKSNYLAMLKHMFPPWLSAEVKQHRDHIGIGTVSTWMSDRLELTPLSNQLLDTGVVSQCM
jgi:hypothetical protein